MKLINERKEKKEEKKTKKKPNKWKQTWKNNTGTRRSWSTTRKERKQKEKERKNNSNRQHERKKKGCGESLAQKRQSFSREGPLRNTQSFQSIETWICNHRFRLRIGWWYQSINQSINQSFILTLARSPMFQGYQVQKQSTWWWTNQKTWDEPQWIVAQRLLSALTIPRSI